MACCSSGGTVGRSESKRRVSSHPSFSEPTLAPLSTDWCVFQAVGIDTLAKRSAIIFSSGGIFPKLLKGREPPRKRSSTDGCILSGESFRVNHLPSVGLDGV